MKLNEQTVEILGELGDERAVSNLVASTVGKLRLE
jgi:hypothetical protein